MLHGACTAMCAWAVVLVLAGARLDAAEPLELVLEAYKATDASLRRGSYRGTFYERQGDRYHADADVRVEFDFPKYHIDLTYRSMTFGDTRRLIVFDGESVGLSRFSPRISVSGAEGEVHPAVRLPTGLVPPQLAGFPWDAANLHRTVDSLDVLVDNVGDRLKSEFAPGGDVILTYPTGSAEATLRYPKKFGYRIASKEVISDSGELLRKSEVTWQRFGDHWFISSLTDLSTRSEVEQTLVITDASIGDAADPQRFTLAALDLPGASRIIDRTSVGSDRAKFHYVPVRDEVIEQATSGILADLERVPGVRNRPPLRQDLAPEAGRSGNTSLLVAVNISLIVLLAVAFWIRRRSRSSDRSRPVQ